MTSEDDDNGILAIVGGEYVGQANQQLPKAETAPDETMMTEIDAGWVGRVRITFQRYTYRRRKFKHVFWVAIRADRVDPA